MSNSTLEIYRIPHVATPIRLMILGDNPHTTELMLRELRRAGFEPDWVQADSEQAFTEHLDRLRDTIDIILADYPLPQLDVTSALRRVQEHRLEIPLVVVTDTLSEESAIEYMHQGVADYVITDRLSRLGPVVVREMERQQRRRAMRRERTAPGVLAYIVEQSPVAIAITDLDTNIEYVNPRFTELTGYTYDQVIGMPASWLGADQPDRDFAKRLIETLMAEGEWHGEFHNRKQTGETYWVSASLSPIRDAGGIVTSFLAVYEDITERKRAEEALRASEEHFHALVEASPVAIIGLDMDSIVRTWNPAATRILGWAAEEAVGRPYVDLIVPADMRDEHRALRAQVMQGEELTNFETRRQRRGGTLFEASISTASLRDPAGRIAGAIVMITDVTEQKRAVAQLRQSEERFRRLIEHASDLLAILDAGSGDILYESPSIVRMLGFTPEELIGKNVFSFVHPDDLPRVSQVFRALLERPRLPVMAEARFLRKDGAWAHLEAVGRLAPELGGVVVNAWDITARKRVEQEVRALNVDLERRVAERTRELAEANAQLQELDRLKSKFVSDVSHDLRAPLANLHLHLGLLEHGKPEKRDEYMITLKSQVGQLVDLVEDILDLSRLEREREQVEFLSIDLNAVAEQVVIANQPRAEAAGLALVFEPSAELPPVWGDRDQLARVIANLTTNAINYTRKGRVRVSTYQIERRACLRVEDTGIGIDPEDLPHVFERFYRGRRVNRAGIPGTGLGLGIVKEIIDLHGGTIDVESRLGEGSTFTMCLQGTVDDEAANFTEVR